MSIEPAKLANETKILKNLKKEVPAIVKYYEAHFMDQFDLYNEFINWIESGDKFRKAGKKILSDSRKGYTMTDKKLKELRKNKAANKEKITEMLEMRRYFYDNGTMAKAMVKTATLKN